MYTYTKQSNVTGILYCKACPCCSNQPFVNF